MDRDAPLFPAIGHPGEGIDVRIARIEGAFNLVHLMTTGIVRSLDQIEPKVERLQSLAQSLEEGAKSSKETAEALALALKEANQQTENQARKDRETETGKRELLTNAQEQATQQATVEYTPTQRIYVVLAAAVPLSAAAYGIFHK